MQRALLLFSSVSGSFVYLLLNIHVSLSLYLPPVQVATRADVHAIHEDSSALSFSLSVVALSSVSCSVELTFLSDSVHFERSL